MTISAFLKLPTAKRSVVSIFFATSVVEFVLYLQKWRRVLFHKADVYVFGRRLQPHDDLSKVLPSRLFCSIDVRTIPRQPDVDFQAVYVLAGTWPYFLEPSILPNESGKFATEAPIFNLKGDEQFVYFSSQKKFDLGNF